MPVRVERHDRILTVVHSRPAARNAVDPEHAEALYQSFLAFDSDDAADVAVVWGEGGAFCAGVDLKKLATRDPTRPSPLEFPKDGGPVPPGPMVTAPPDFPLCNSNRRSWYRLVGQLVVRLPEITIVTMAAGTGGKSRGAGGAFRFEDPFAVGPLAVQSGVLGKPVLQID